MQSFYYCRDDQRGKRDFSSVPKQKPDASVCGFGDFLHNIALGEADGFAFHQVGRERSVPRRTIANRRASAFILHYVTDGKGTYNGRVMTRGDGFVAFPGQFHTMAADADEPWHFSWISVSGNELYTLLQSVGVDAEHPYFTFSFFDELAALFDEWIYEEHADIDLHTYCISMLYRLLSLWRCEYRQSAHKNDLKYAGVQEAMALINDAYDTDIRIEKLAEQVHLSRKYFCRLFTEYCGISPKEYISQRRMSVAMRRLAQTDLSVAEIAASVGYSDYTQLSRLFKSKLGISPQQYRSRSIQLE